MAKASALATGMEVHIISGDYEGGTAIVVDPTPVPDGQDNQRKVKVQLTNVFGHDDEPFVTYILPRMLDTRREVGANEMVAALTTVDHGFLVAAEDITDPMDPALDRFRPDASIVEVYRSRMVPGDYTDVEFMLQMREQRDRNGYSPNVALVGETQSGKTMLVEVLAVLAAQRDGMPKPYPVFTLSGSSGVTSYDIFGQTTAVIIDGKETLVWMEGLAALAAKCGGFLYLDEWNAVAPSQAVAIHCMLDHRRQFINTQKAIPDGHGGFFPEVVKANQNLWIIATINPGYKGTQTMAEATSNRFRWLSWDYDESVEKALIPSKTIRALGKSLREALHQRTISLPVGTSVLQRLNDDCATFGTENALWGFMSLFPPQERGRVEAIIEDTGVKDLLESEYPNPIFVQPTAGGGTGSVPGSTWGTDALAQQV